MFKLNFKLIKEWDAQTGDRYFCQEKAGSGKKEITKREYEKIRKIIKMLVKNGLLKPPYDWIDIHRRKSRKKR